MDKIGSVEEYITNHKLWSEELRLLRNILADSELTETIKWGAPVYTYHSKNIVGLGGFKSYFGIWFFQGALLKDPANKLVNAQEGKTKALRQWRFQSKQEIDPGLLKKYIQEAIQNQKDGREIKPEKKKLVVPDELVTVLNDYGLMDEFNQLNLTNKRDFAEYIEQAKRSETKKNRIDKIIPMIRSGIGLHDKYK